MKFERPTKRLNNLEARKAKLNPHRLVNKNQLAKALDAKARRISAVLIEVGKADGNPFFGKMYENGNLAPDAAKNLIKVAKTAERLQVTIRVLAKAVVRRAKRKKNYIPLSHFSGKTAEKCLKEWQNEVWGKYRTTDVEAVPDSSEDIQELRLKADQKKYNELLADLKDPDVAFSMGASSFSPAFIIDYLGNYDKPKIDELLKAMRIMCKAKYDEVCSYINT